jgi:hypothetical protein
MQMLAKTTLKFSFLDLYTYLLSRFKQFKNKERSNHSIIPEKEKFRTENLKYGNYTVVEITEFSPSSSKFYHRVELKRKECGSIVVMYGKIAPLVYVEDKHMSISYKSVFLEKAVLIKGVEFNISLKQTFTLGFLEIKLKKFDFSKKK